MKKLITILFLLHFSLTGVKAATAIQITNINSQIISTFRLGIESEEAQIIRYTDKGKIGLSLYSWYTQWNNNFSDAWLFVATAAGQILQTGSYYTNLHLFGFYPDKPQLDWGILDGPTINMNDPNGRSWFRILEMDFNILAIDAYDGEANFVSGRYNSNIPLTIPEPGAPILMMASLLLFWRRKRR